MKPVRGRTLESGELVYVYFNLHKHCFSVKSMKTGLVVAHTNDITLSLATFKVSEAGRLRVLREKRKNVHAGVIGFYQKDHALSIYFSHQATYNPYFYESFVERSTKKPVWSADLVRLVDKKIHFADNREW